MLSKKNSLGSKKLMSLCLAIWLVIGMLPLSAFADSTLDWSKAMTQKMIQNYAANSEERDWWEIIALAINDVKRSEDNDLIHSRVIDRSGELIRDNEILSKSILALRALGKDPMNYHGKDLLSALGEMDIPNDIKGISLRLAAFSSDYYEYPEIEKKINELIGSLYEKVDGQDIWYEGSEDNWQEPTGWALLALSFYYRHLETQSGELEGQWPEVNRVLLELNIKESIEDVVQGIESRQNGTGDVLDGDLKKIALLAGAVASCGFELSDALVDGLKNYTHPDLEGEFKNDLSGATVAQGEDKGLAFLALTAKGIIEDSGIGVLDMRWMEKKAESKHQIGRLEQIEDIEVPIGTSRGDLPLPKKVKAFLTDNILIEIPDIRWDRSVPGYDPDQAGEYVFEGSYELPKDVEGAKPKLTCKVIVKGSAPEDKNITWARGKIALIGDSYSAQKNINDWWKIAEIGRIGKEIKPENLEYLFRQTFSKGELSNDVGVLLKGVLAIRAMGYDPEDFYGANVVEALVNAKAGRGIWDEAPKVWALSSDEWEKTDVSDAVRELIDRILSRREANGLWSGYGGWEDATGFALYALGPYYNNEDYPEEQRERVREAVEKAVDAISERQRPNGDLKEDPGNLNSLAMVAGGLWSCDPKYLHDARLVKNGKTLLDAIREYDVLGEPELLWKKDGTKNGVPMATEQGLRALITLDRVQSGEGYVFDYRGLPKKKADTLFIKKIEGVQNLSVDFGTPREELQLPSKAIFILSDDTKREVDLTWKDSKPPYDPNTNRWYNFIAEYDMPEGINGEKPDIRVTVTVKAPSVEKAKAALKESIDKAKKLLEKKDRYEEKTVAALEEQVKRSESALLDQKAKYDQILQQKKELDDAISKLKEKQNQGGGGSGGGGGGSILPSNDITVYFTLRSIERGGTKEEIWVPRQAVTVPKGSKVFAAFDKMMKKYGLEYINKGNYISEILSPTDGKWFGEFSNGINSGWMYMVNGKHPMFGLEEFEIHDKDEIIWHYTNDYRYEQGSEQWQNENFGGGGGSVAEGDTRVKIEVQDGIGKVGPTGKLKKMLQLSIDEVKKLSDDKKIVSLDLRAEKDLKGFEIILDKEVISQVTAEDKLSLSIKSNVMEMLIDPKALQEIKKAQDKISGDVKFEAKRIEKASNIPTDKAKEVEQLIGTRPILEIHIKVNDQKISEYPNGKLTFKIPYTIQKVEDKNKLTVYRIEKEALTEMENVVFDDKNNTVQFTTDHLSYYGVGLKTDQIKEDKVPLASINKFKDVPETAWYAKAVYAMAEKDLIRGKEQDLFKPNDKVSRAEFLSILARIDGVDIEKAEKVRFRDVKEGAWYFSSISWAVENNIANGYGKDFRPHAPISREEIAVILVNYSRYNKEIKISEKAAEKTFKDQNKIAPWAVESVRTMQKAEIVGGRENDLFAPKAHATRAEAAEMIYRMIG